MQINSWEQFVDGVLLRKTAFVLAFFTVFTLSYGVLSALDWLPELVSEENKPQVEVVKPVLESEVAAPAVIETPVVMPEAPVYPLSIIIPSLDKEVEVYNPTSRAVADLDAALLNGVVRHPDSATLEQNGTVFLLGHSSYLPAVKNKAFQAFNGIQNLKWGDEIIIESLDETYVYRVEKVYRAQAQDVTVPIAGDKQKLVLATCNSFGSVDDRFIVEAELLEVKQALTKQE